MIERSLLQNGDAALLFRLTTGRGAATALSARGVWKLRRSPRPNEQVVAVDLVIHWRADVTRRARLCVALQFADMLC